MPTIIARQSVEYVECCGVVVPVTTNARDERAAYKEIALGNMIVLAVSLPVSLVIFYLLL
ncbi:hypothetical protein D3Y55_19860 [Mesorhizobium sp. DCY119]|nr:hypothetical protein D3Y55_19860 [Mesorhizobium sp. DCY119]